MSKPINPITIGSFTVGALLLLVAGILLFGGGELFGTDKVRFVVFFDSSLNGLEIGAPVKMQGVRIGEVKEITLQVDPKSGKLYKPVVIDIDRNFIKGPGGTAFPKSTTYSERLANRDRLVDAGFRARLEMQSLLTGLLYVDLDLHPNRPPVFLNLEYKGLVEIPGIPKTTDELRNTAEELAKKLRTLPLDQIVQDLADSLKEIKKILASDDVKKSTEALAKTLEGMDKTVSTLNRKLEPLLKDTNKSVQNANLLVQDSRAMVRDMHQDLKPLLASTDKTLAAATAALNQAERSMATVGDAVGTESALTETLEALKDASRSLKELTDFLERHPESLISGKEN